MCFPLIVFLQYRRCFLQKNRKKWLEDVTKRLFLRISNRKATKQRLHACRKVAESQQVNMTQEQFNREVLRLRPTLIIIAKSYLCQWEEAEDAVQDVLAKMWTMHDELKIPIDGLAKVVLRNVCVSRLRMKKSLNQLEHHYAETAEDADSANEYVDKMLMLIEELPPKQQIILRLRHIDGMEMSEIAKLTGSNEVTVRKQLSRARQTLRMMFIRKKSR